ncbi:synaptonemal complex protein 2-like [Pelobates fuscus]|uniref:synaptonemal complex protein 2-like n=1 Tax=Pelobates fuscus TaxID=191477 RepID=UPI002FE4E9CF
MSPHIAPHNLCAGEEKVKPIENTESPTEYYLETLISDAFKGKGFQKISELVEDKIACSSQRYSKVLLNQLDRLINKELDRNEFKNVSLLLKCIQYFCKNDCQEGSLIRQGLVAKMVLWFERTIDFLNISGKTDPFISALVEDFYDTALVICKGNCDEGRKQLLDSFLFRLALIVTEKWPPCHVRLEALRTLNFILDNCSREEKKRLQSCEELCILTQDLARTILEAGDYDIQVAVSEALCRMMVKKWRDSFASRWFGDGILTEAFKEIKDKDFETDCRKFLNILNTRRQDKRGVYTFPCITVLADMDKLIKPQDDKLEHFWIDFNVESQCISFYIHNTEGSLWDSVRLQKDELSSYNLQEIDGQKILHLYLKKPLLINNKNVTKVKIYFEPELDIQNAVCRVFNGEGSMVSKICSAPAVEKESVKPAEMESSKPSNAVRTSSTTYEQWKNDQANEEKVESLSDILFSQTSGSIGTKVSSGAASTPKRSEVIDSQEVLIEYVPLEAVIPVSEEQLSTSADHGDSRDVILDDSADVSDVVVQAPTKFSKSSAQQLKVRSPEIQAAKKIAEDLYEFQFSSDSPVCGKVSESKEKILVPKASTYRRQVLQTSPDEKQTSNYKSHLFSESNGVASNNQSDKSWVINFQKKSSTKSANYSRKKRRRHGNLKVLPLSSESSSEEKDSKSRGNMSKFTSLNKYSTPDKGKAKTLSSELKLPGISNILTPEESRVQDSALLNPNDYDDVMDPLVETSSPQSSKHSETPAKYCLRSALNDRGSVEMKDPGVVEYLKRRRLSHDANKGSENFDLKPKKLFKSSEKKAVPVPADIEDDSMDSDIHEQDFGEASVITAFEMFTKDLKNKFLSRYKRMEIRAHKTLEVSHQKVSNLLGEIQQCRLQKLNNFNKIVVHELSSLEAEIQSLKGLENETVMFWEEHSEKMSTFWDNQRQRIKAIDSKFDEKMTKLANTLEKTIKDEITMIPATNMSTN